MALADFPTAEDLRQPGLYYVHRDGATVTRLDGLYLPSIDRPERDIVAALAAYVAEKLTLGESS